MVLIHDRRQVVVTLRLAHPLFQLKGAQGEGVRIACGESNRLAHGLLRVEIRFLAEKSDADTAGDGERAALRVQAASHQTKEGALAGPIGADQGKAVPSTDLKGRPGEDIVPTVGVIDGGGLEEEHMAIGYRLSAIGCWPVDSIESQAESRQA